MDVSSNLVQSETDGDVTTGGDADACRVALNGGSKSFHTASLLLPRSFASKATSLYAFCRMADDAIDEGECKDTALAMLHRRLEAIYAGSPEPHACDRELEKVVRQVDLPKGLLLALLEGFEWDAKEKRYQTLEDVIAYSMRVAGTVGVMMTVLMGVRERRMLARAADLGAAMQLTNIARDVGEDARAGRLYLPETWMREAGIDVEKFLEKPEFSENLSGVIEKLLETAEGLYQRADSGLASLPWACRPGMYAARVLYAGIGDALTTVQFDSVNQRAYTDATTKLRLLSRVPKVFTMTATQIELGLSIKPLPEAEFLLACVKPESAAAPVSKHDAGEDNRNSVERILDLFEDLHQYELQQSRAQKR